MADAQKKVVEAVEAKLDELGVETDASGRRAKAYLYCVEVTCPKTKYRVPLAPSWVISKNLRTIAKLVPRPSNVAPSGCGEPAPMRRSDFRNEIDGSKRR